VSGTLNSSASPRSCRRYPRCNTEHQSRKVVNLGGSDTNGFDFSSDVNYRVIFRVSTGTEQAACHEPPNSKLLVQVRSTVQSIRCQVASSDDGYRSVLKLFSIQVIRLGSRTLSATLCIITVQMKVVCRIDLRPCMHFIDREPTAMIVYLFF